MLGWNAYPESLGQPLRTSYAWNSHRTQSIYKPHAHVHAPTPLLNLQEQWLRILSYFGEEDIYRAAEASTYLDHLIRDHWRPGGELGPNWIVQRHRVDLLRIYPVSA
jgi:hypothetical protein